MTPLSGGDGSVFADQLLVIFTRYPEPGTTKTRLIPALGAQGAADLQRRMTEHTLRRAREFRLEYPLTIQVCHDGGTVEGFRGWLGEDLLFSPQRAGDLGQRMEQAIRESLHAGAARVVLVGTDCPGMTPAHLRRAFEGLADKDVVLGPAKDGGYYLIGLGQQMPEIFRGIPWGSEDVLERTLQIAEAKNLRIELLDRLDDVDREEDLPVWEREVSNAGSATSNPRISIILPAYNEAARIRATLASTQGAEFVVERLVVDGGSRDGTVEQARAGGAKVLNSLPGKALQMNAGAQAAVGDTLLFLHADTCLPRDFDQHVRRILALPGTIAGAFRLRFDGSARALRVIERLANFRAARLGIPYGDQAIFISKARFHRAGGFPEMALMEDFEFMRRLRSQGRIGIAPVTVVTSARRYETKGIVRTVMLNQVIILSYLLGVSPERLAGWYRGSARNPEGSI